MFRPMLVERLGKMMEQERLLPLILVAIATVCLFTGICDYDSWCISAGTFSGCGMGALMARKRFVDQPQSVDITEQVNDVK